MKYREEFFKSRNFVGAQSWMFAALAGASLAFFFALLAASERMLNSTSISIFAEPLFCVSLVFGAAFSFIIKLSNEDGELIHHLNTSRLFRWVPVLSVWSFVAGILAVMFAFSSILAIFSMGLLAFAYFSFFVAIKKR